MRTPVKPALIPAAPAIGTEVLEAGPVGAEVEELVTAPPVGRIVELPNPLVDEGCVTPPSSLLKSAQVILVLLG